MSEQPPKPQDVLAADAFTIGARDSRYPPDPTGIQKPHDTLAAEEFPMPVREARFPEDPSGIEAPHDTLAAEEFPMPAASPGLSSAGRDFRAKLWLAMLALLMALTALLRARRKR
ncbi:MAG TPA: hypothetical protein VEQ61_04745 [Thermoleophilaceae bacterium]|nr:hypothetical protein [Thermoleophilaceae bacterium]